MEIIGETQQMKKLKSKDKKRNRKKQRDSVKSARRKQKRKKALARNRSQRRTSLHKEIIVGQINEMKKPTFDRNAFGSSAPSTPIISENIQNVLEKKEGFNKSAWSQPTDE